METSESGSSSKTKSWEATRGALESLENVLKCIVCQHTFSDPVTLSTCGHTFCRKCCLAEELMRCPECKVPIWTRDLNPSHHVKNILSAVTTLRELVFKTPPSSSSTPPSSSLVLLQEAHDKPHCHRQYDLADAVKEDKSVVVQQSRGPAASADLPPHKLTRRVKKNERSMSTYDSVTARNTERLKRNVKRKNRDHSQCDHCDATVVIQKRQGTEKAKEVTPTNSDGRTGGLRVRRVLRPRRVLADSSNVAPVSGSRPLDSQSSEADVDLADVTSRAGIASKLRNITETSSSLPVQGSRKRKAVAVVLEDVLESSRRKISKPATIEKKNQRGETPLHQAAIKGDRAQAELLLKQGADPNHKDHAGWTPLHDASHHGHCEVVSLLLDRGALVDSPGYCNNTALHEAVGSNCSQVASLLLQHGASVNLKNKYGQTARDMGNFQWIDEILSQASGKPPVKPALRTLHASPELNGGMGRVVLLATGLRSHQKIILSEVAASLNAEVMQKFSPEVTHVVTNSGSGDVSLRTYKLLCGIATGKWVVRFEWIEVCSSQQQWVDETPYEVSGVCTADGTRSPAACRRARENQLFGAPGLFDGCHFYLHGSFSPPQPSRAELASLLQNSGGNLLHREPDLDPGSIELHTHPYHANSACTGNIFILVDHEASNSAKMQKWRSLGDLHPSIAVVSVAWVLDSITQFQLLPMGSLQL